MHRPDCPHCKTSFCPPNGGQGVVRFGQYFRRSDKKYVLRFKCKSCGKYFSLATLDICYWQRKRHLNSLIRVLLASGNTQRRIAKMLRVNRKTVVRKFLFLGQIAVHQLKIQNERASKVSCFEFDDLETYEHTKCKPVSVTLAVEYKTRRILGFAPSQMPARGRIAVKALRKYGPRPDERAKGREALFSEIKNYVQPGAIIKSDQNPHYIKDVKRHFPDSQHIAYKGRKPADAGQGELKVGIFDPLFSLNHTFAKMRADIARLIRETWTTTKKIDRLYLNIAIMAVYHNENLNF